jgi:hypothetical protein
MKLTSVERIGRSQLIPGVGRTTGGAMRRLTAGLVFLLAFSAETAWGIEIDAAVGGLYSFRCCKWSLHISADGAAQANLYPDAHLSRRFALSPSEMRDLETILHAEDFLSLDSELGALPVDGPDAQIRVKLGKREHTVVLHSLPYELLPIWRTDRTQFGRAWRVCERLRALVGVPKAMHCPGIDDDSE